MSQQSSREKVGERYLLRTLSEVEREQLEEQYFSDDAAFYDLEIAEDEVVDRYVGGKLTPAERQRFEETLDCSPRLKERVKVARLLATEIDRRQANEIAAPVVAPVLAKPGWLNRWFGSHLQLTPAFRGTMAVAIAVVLVIETGLIVAWLNSRSASQQLASDKARIELQIQNLQNEIEKEKAIGRKLDDELRTRQDEINELETKLAELRARVPDDSSPAVALAVPVTLVPSALRSSGSTPVARVGPNTSAVEITLQLRANEYPQYNVIIETPEGRRMHSETGLKPRDSGAGPTITFRVGVRKIPRGDYIVRLEAAGSNETVDNYYLQVMPAR